MNENIIDNSSDRKYFTQVCNIVDELDLSPLAIALYLHYKRWSNVKDSAGFSVRYLMTKYKTGSDKIRHAKQELVSAGLIHVISYDAKLCKADDVIVLDIWERNILHFRPVTIQSQVVAPVTIQSQTCHYPVTDLSLSSDTLKEIRKKEIVSDADASPDDIFDILTGAVQADDKTEESLSTEENNATAQTIVTAAPAVPAIKLFVKTKRQAGAKLTDAEFFAGLKTAYTFIDVETEYKKAVVWCATKNRQMTRQFFVSSWLNRLPQSGVSNHSIGQDSAGKPYETMIQDGETLYKQDDGTWQNSDGRVVFVVPEVTMLDRYKAGQLKRYNIEDDY